MNYSNNKLPTIINDIENPVAGRTEFLAMGKRYCEFHRFHWSGRANGVWQPNIYSPTTHRDLATGSGPLIIITSDESYYCANLASSVPQKTSSRKNFSASRSNSILVCVFFLVVSSMYAYQSNYCECPRTFLMSLASRLASCTQTPPVAYGYLVGLRKL